MRRFSDSMGALLALAAGRPERVGALVRACYSRVSGGLSDRLAFDSFADGRLNLLAPDAHWKLEGCRAESELLARINDLLGQPVVRSMSVTVDAAAGAQRSRAPTLRQAENFGEPPRAAERAAARIDSERARQAFLRFAASAVRGRNATAGSEGTGHGRF